MTELEKIRYAKKYIDNLADGINPINNMPLPEDTILNDVHLSRCFFFVSDILRMVIDNGGAVTKRTQGTIKNSSLPPFTLTDEQRYSIELSATPVMIRYFTERINNLIDTDAMRKLKVTAFTNWLLGNGMLYEEVVNNQKRKKPTQLGEELGIYSEEREGQYGRYLATLYNESAQRYLVNNLDEIIKISNGEV